MADIKMERRCTCCGARIPNDSFVCVVCTDNFQKQTGASLGIFSPNEHDDTELGPNLKDFAAYSQKLLNPPRDDWKTQRSAEERWNVFVNFYLKCKPVFRVLYPEFIESMDAMLEDCKFQYLTEYFIKQKGDMVVELAKPYLT